MKYNIVFIHDHVKIQYDKTSENVELYHCHTDESPPGSEDFKAFCNPNISKIGVASKNGDGWIIDATYGIRPDEDELMEIVHMCYEQSNEDLQSDPNYFNWTPEEKYYMMVREGMRRISNYFEWDVMGGVLSE